MLHLYPCIVMWNIILYSLHICLSSAVQYIIDISLSNMHVQAAMRASQEIRSIACVDRNGMALIFAACLPASQILTLHGHKTSYGMPWRLHHTASHTCTTAFTHTTMATHTTIVTHSTTATVIHRYTVIFTPLYS